MRKKSHISLSLYLVNEVDSPLLDAHKKAFILGSVLPDCKPSFVTTKHNIEETFDKVSKYISDLTEDAGNYKRISTAYCRRLGEVTHYLADYFTFPHNHIFEGNMREHCKYEKYLKHAMKAYVHSDAVELNRHAAQQFHTPQDLLDYVLQMHQIYLKSEKTVESDCRYIVSLCHVIVEGILALLELECGYVAA